MTTTATTPATARTAATIRPLLGGDTETVHRVFAQLSARSAFLRFHTGLPRLSPVMVGRLAAVVPGQHEVLVAEHEGRPVGLARWIRDVGDPTAVEVAVEVADAVQGRGIGGHLLRAALSSARSAGATTLLAHVHPDNVPVVAWLTRLGADRPLGPDEPFRLPLPVPEADGGSEPCGCMTACRSGYSDPSGWGATSATPCRSGVSVRGRSSPSSCRGAADPSPPRSSSTSCGARTPAA
ncbi:MAG TPA: GNAT family N-acetyltransferase [Ornithinibacter sp.]|nr:GNAT family N-acetyltransferase [Ornithinibacter sp.]